MVAYLECLLIQAVLCVNYLFVAYSLLCLYNCSVVIIVVGHQLQLNPHKTRDGRSVSESAYSNKTTTLYYCP